MNSEPFGRLRRFVRELKRRNVYKVAVAYVAVAFVGLQAVNLLIPATTLPSWADQLFLGVVILGFPVSVVVAWAFEMTAEGMRRTPEAETGRAIGSAYQWIGLALVVALAGGVWYLTARGGKKATTAQPTATDDTVVRSTAAARDTADPPRVAVLPFENIAPDTTEDYFAQGMHEEVLNQLSKVSGVELISRTSVMQYAQTNKTVREISRELGGVNALLEGTVRRAGDQLRITTQLIEAPEDEHLWSTTYERKLSTEAIFDIQAEIAEQVARALETELVGNERQRIASAPTDNLAAYDAYLRGRARWLKTYALPLDSAETYVNESVRHLREAVHLDTAFAEAYGWLGMAFAHKSRITGENRWTDSADVAIARARRVDREVAQAYMAEGLVYEVRDSVQGRIDAFRRAVELQPDNVFATAELSDALVAGGHYAEAVRVARRGIELGPRSPEAIVEMADQLRAVGLYDAAEAWDRRALEIESDYSQALIGLSQTYWAQGRFQRALKAGLKYLEDPSSSEYPPTLRSLIPLALQASDPRRARLYLRRLLEVLPDATPDDPAGREMRPRDRAWLGLAEVQLGKKDAGRKLLRQAADTARVRLQRDTANNVFERFTLAGVHAVLGDTNEALKQLERWRGTVGDDWLLGLVTISSSPLLDNLRSEPRFQALVKEFQSEQRKARERVLEQNIDLYPPGRRGKRKTSLGDVTTIPNRM